MLSDLTSILSCLRALAEAYFLRSHGLRAAVAPRAPRRAPDSLLALATFGVLGTWAGRHLFF